MKEPWQDTQIIKYFIILLISKPETRRGYGGFYVKYFRWSLYKKILGWIQIQMCYLPRNYLASQ